MTCLRLAQGWLAVLLAHHGLAEAGSSGRRRSSSLKYVIPELGTTIFDVVTSFGAKGDNKTLDTAALQAALFACGNSSDGGIVRLPAPGVYLSEALFAKNLQHCGLQLEAGATLFAHYSKDWSSAFLRFEKARHFAIFGGGTVDANGWHWWPSASKGKFRPHVLDLSKCETVAIHDVTFLDGANHMLELYSDNTEIANVTVKVNWDWWYGAEANVNLGAAVMGAVGPNTDGIDVHGTPFYIHDSHIDVGDDNVAIHASHVLIEDCLFGDDGVGAHGHGVSIGSVGNGSMHENITVRNSHFLNTHVGPNIKIHGDATVGYVRNVLYENLTIEGSQKENLRISTTYDAGETSTTSSRRRNSAGGFVVNNITYRNITTKNTKSHYVTFLCTEAIPCTDIHLENVHMDKESKRDFQCSSTSGTMQDVSPSACLNVYHGDAALV